MTSLQLYNNFLIKVNRDDSNSNVNVPRGKFVVIYNEQAKRWLKEKLTDKLKNRLSSDELDDYAGLLVDNVEVKKLKTHKDHIDYTLPADYFNLSSSFSQAKRGNCRRNLTNWKSKPYDIPLLMSDQNNKPSFDFEETLLTISGDKLKVYQNDFTIEKVYINYYRFPKDIDIEGYINLDNSQSISINPDIADVYVNEIINRCAIEVMRTNEKTEGFQFSKERINTEY